MPSGPGALFGADVWIALAISARVTAGHWRVGLGGMYYTGRNNRIEQANGCIRRVCAFNRVVTNE